MSRVEDVLAAHRFSAQAYYQRTDQWTARCLADDCDWTARGDTGGRDAAEAAHRAHVAAALAAAGIGDTAVTERSLRAYEVRHTSGGRPVSDRDGKCVCDYNPESTQGPEEDCPFHGRPYAYWVEQAAAAEARGAQAVLDAVEDVDPWPMQTTARVMLAAAREAARNAGAS